MKKIKFLSIALLLSLNSYGQTDFQKYVEDMSIPTLTFSRVGKTFEEKNDTIHVNFRDLHFEKMSTGFTISIDPFYVPKGKYFAIVVPRNNKDYSLQIYNDHGESAQLKRSKVRNSNNHNIVAITADNRVYSEAEIDNMNYDVYSNWTKPNSDFKNTDITGTHYFSMIFFKEKDLENYIKTNGRTALIGLYLFDTKQEFFAFRTFIENLNSPANLKEETKEAEKVRDNNEALVIDEQQYKTTKIGEQVWSAENLNVSYFQNGDPVPYARTKEEWNKAAREKKPAYCYLGNNEANKNLGKFYNGYAVNDPRGIAPKSWRIPSKNDWDKLATYMRKSNGTDAYQDKLKSTKGWSKYNFKKNGTNETGFNAIPTGYSYSNEELSGSKVANSANWWSTNKVIGNKYAENSLFSTVLEHVDDGLNTNYSFHYSEGLSIRLIKE